MSDHTHSKQSGEWTWEGWHGELERGATVQCAHCQFSWRLEKGSGRLRGWCFNCNGFVCGPACAECVPLGRRLENVEAGKHPLTPGAPKILVPPGVEGLS